MSKENELVVFQDATQLQNELVNVVSKYDNLTDEELIAKRPEINKEFTKYNQERIKVNREINNFMKNILEPIQDLKDKVDTLHAEAEQKRKDAKESEIRTYFAEKYYHDEKYLNKVWDERWLNRTHDKWKAEMDVAINGIVTDLKTIERLGFNEDEYWQGKTLEEFYAEEQEQEVVIEIKPEPKPINNPDNFIVKVEVDAEQLKTLESFLKSFNMNYKITGGKEVYEL